MNKPNYKKGDIVVCIKNDGYRSYLTIGESYKVIGIRKLDGVYYVQIISDDFYNSPVTTVSNRFMILNEFKKIQRKEKLNQLKLA